MTSPLTPQDIAVSVNGLSHSYGSHVALDSVSFSVRRGGIFGFLGPNGSGKTTLALSLLRLVPPPGEIVSGSRIVINEQDVMRLSNRDLRHIRGRKVSLVRQNPLAHRAGGDSDDRQFGCLRLDNGHSERLVGHGLIVGDSLRESLVARGASGHSQATTSQRACRGSEWRLAGASRRHSRSE